MDSNNSNISNSQIISDAQAVNNQLNCTLGNPEDNILRETGLEQELQDLLLDIRQSSEADKVIINAEINQRKIEDLNNKVSDALNEAIASQNYDTNKVKHLVSAFMYSTKALIRITKNKELITSYLQKYYTALCSTAAYIDPDANRVIAIIEAGISMSLMSNQATSWLSPFLAARPIINSLGIGFLMVDASKRCIQTGKKLSTTIKDAVSPLIVKTGNKLMPVCKTMANCTLTAASSFITNTRTGRAIDRGTQRVFKSSSKMVRKVRKNIKRTVKNARAVKNEVTTGVDRMGRNMVRMAFHPKQALVSAYNFCRNMVISLSSPTCRVVGLETGIKSSSKKSSSSVASSASSIASEEAKEIIENVFSPNASELLDSAYHPM